MHSGALEMAQYLRAHAVLAEDVTFVHSTHVRQLTTTRNSSFKGCENRVRILWVPAYMCACALAHCTHIN